MPGCTCLERDFILIAIMSESTQTNQPNHGTFRTAARHLYETTPATFEEVGKEFGVADRTVKRWSAADGGWSKLDGSEITARAQGVADSIQSAVTDIGPQASDEERQAVVAQFRADAAVDQRAAVLARHRHEWNGPRALAYEAIKKRDIELAKLAKSSAEALRIVQEGERKAWGLDAGEMGSANVIVIERTTSAP